MFVITVAPLRREIMLDSLSYFSSIAYTAGTILTVPVRNTLVPGLVIKSEEVSGAKTALRAATFSLKKLPPQENPPCLGAAYIRTAEWLAGQYASPVGTILYHLLPPEIRSGDIPLPHTHHIVHTHEQTPQLLHAPRTDRYLAYRSLVRETFAHSGSVLIVVPSSIDAHEVERELQSGIEDRIIRLTSSMTKSELRKAYAQLDDFSRTKLIIATASHAMVERHDVTLVIVEQSRSSYYKEMTRPYLDYRDVLARHAQYTGRTLLLADILPRTEEEFKRREDIYATYGETPKRVHLHGTLDVVDMNKKSEPDAPAFSLLAPETIQAIKDTRRRKGNIFLFAARRGLAPLVACMDCGHIFRSKESGAPYSLVRIKKGDVEERWFVCSSSGERVRAPETCPECSSWRLRERGIGIQQVYDELHKLFPTTPVTLFDHITARTYKKAVFLQETFYKTRGSILLGTHMALPYLTTPVDLSVVVNMDALLATPTWRLEEENLALLLTLRERTRGRVVVQTRTKESSVIDMARMGAVEQFYTEELALRKTFNYPPYATFIHATWQGAPDAVKKIEETLQHTFKDYGISTYPHPSAPPDTPIMYALMRLPAASWPDKKLGALIRGLPPSVRIVVNPDRIV